MAIRMPNDQRYYGIKYVDYSLVFMIFANKADWYEREEC